MNKLRKNMVIQQEKIKQLKDKVKEREKCKQMLA